MVQRDVFLLILGVDQHRMAMIKSPAAAVLPGKTDRNPFSQQRTEGQRFRHAVIERCCARPHFLALLQQLFYFGMDREILGIAGKSLRDLPQSVFGYSSRNFQRRVVAPADVLVPVRGQTAE